MTRCDKTAIVLALTPALLAPFALTLLPERIPTHWNLAGQADGWGSPLGLLIFFQALMGVFLLLGAVQSLILRQKPKFAAIGKRLMAGIMGFQALLMVFAFGLAWYVSQFGAPAPGMASTVILAFTLLFLILLYVLTPKMFPDQPGNAAITRRILLATMLFFVLLAAVAAVTPLREKPYSGPTFMISGLGWLFIVIGNLMPKLKTNPWAGIRVKWTLEDPQIWYKTHRFAGRLWFAGGIPLALAPFIFPLRTVQIMMWVDLAVLCATPIFYAWHLARRKRRLSQAGRGEPDMSRSA